MKVFLRKCAQCQKLMPLLSYFLSKEENQKLTKEEKKICYDCYKKRRKNESQTD
jgi:hypothetical protein